MKRSRRRRGIGCSGRFRRAPNPVHFGMLLFRMTRPADRTTDTIGIVHQGRSYEVRLRRSAQAKRYTLRVRAATQEIILTMPTRGSVAVARDFAERHSGWVATRLSRLPGAVPFEPGAEVPLRGVPHRLVHRSGSRAGAETTVDADGQPTIAVGGEPSHFARRVRDFLKREARRDLEAATLRHAATLNVTIKRITIKDTMSRWGSCTSDGRLSYSWRLILAPPQVLGYLAAHEVAHRIEMNHSPRYWQVLRALDPATDTAEAWLRRHGSDLHRYGATP
jgi:hypothetical protein